MKETQCVKIAKRLLSGKSVTRQWCAKNYILCPHSRIRQLNGWIAEQSGRRFTTAPKGNPLRSDPYEIGAFIRNLQLRNVCAEYELPYSFRPLLRKALRKHTK